MNKTADDFVEIPGWVRLWTNAYWSGGPRSSRRQAHLAEAICMAGGIAFLFASFLVTSDLAVTICRVAA